ncbi:MAG TPA: medium chain dehydrogenase/reductase family protein [Longimicrobiales bacterium]
MQRVRIHRPGGYDRLELERDFDPGSPGPGEVLVRVRAAGVNFADSAVRMGLYSSAKEYVGWPITPGFEFAGTIAQVGADVASIATGDEVFGVVRFGAWSSHVVTRAELVRPLPAGLTMTQAAGIPTVFLTAWYPLHALTRVRARDVVLVHSAAGGVGSALVQLAKAAGCRVVGVVGAAHKVEVARGMGADVVIDRSATDDVRRALEQAAPLGYDVVLDANGGPSLRDSYELLAPGGRLVVYGFHAMLPKGAGRPSWPRLAREWMRTPRFSPFRMVQENRSVLAFNLSYLFDRADVFQDAIDDIVGWLNEKRVHPLEVHAFPVDRVADAQRAIESGQTTGKLVLTFDD